ncbi:hypothetical protein ALC56_10446 [Trachymyrmex septentrionalis]|uniref:Uncharacterized protein n=1 Tax=Trachymyrmex septentrionalis TaxID=34720 RepID=A0A195F4G1_9HYME|nr:hypothetical protein ALC56_10446 [Trachymyrmex septentrionalis]
MNLLFCSRGRNFTVREACGEDEREGRLCSLEGSGGRGISLSGRSIRAPYNAHTRTEILHERETWRVSSARGCSFSKARLHFLFHKRTTSNYIVRAVASACKWEKRARGDTTVARRHKSKSRIGYTPVTVFDKSVRRNDATGSDAKQNAFCFHLWHVRVRRPLYRRGTSVTRTLVEPVGSGRCLTLFPSTRPVSDAFV